MAANGAETIKSTVDQFTTAGNQAFKDSIEKSLSALGEANAHSKKNLEAVVASVTAATKGAEALGAQTMAYSKKAMEDHVAAAKSLKVGDGLDKDTRMGPLANARRLDAMNNIVADCQSRGGKLAAGGKRHGNQGYFFEPTVVTDLPDDSKIMTQEPFGPIAPIIPFKTFDEVVARANSLPFGLAAYAFTNNAKQAAAIGDALEAGMVGVNTYAISMAETPFGGIKESGYGHEGSIEGLEMYTVKKYIAQA